MWLAAIYEYLVVNVFIWHYEWQLIFFICEFHSFPALFYCCCFCICSVHTQIQTHTHTKNTKRKKQPFVVVVFLQALQKVNRFSRLFSFCLSKQRNRNRNRNRIRHRNRNTNRTRGNTVTNLAFV